MPVQNAFSKCFSKWVFYISLYSQVSIKQASLLNRDLRVACLFKTIFNIPFQNGYLKMVRKNLTKIWGGWVFPKSYVIIRSGSWQMLISPYKVGGWAEKPQNMLT